MAGMTDQTALPPVPGVVDLHARLPAGETLYGAFAGVGIAVAAEIMARAGFDWLIIDLEHGAGDRIGAAGQPPRDGRDAGGRPRPATVRRAAADRTRARSRRARDHGSAGGPARAGARGDLVHALPARWRARAGALDARGGSRRARPYADPGDQPRILGIIQIESRSAVEHADGDRRASTASTSCSSARPTCRTAWGSPGSSTTRDYLAAIERVVAAAEGAGKAAGILLRDAAGTAAPPRPRVPVHRARLGRGVHQRRRAGRHGRHPRLTRRSARPPAIRTGRARARFAHEALHLTS